MGGCIDGMGGRCALGGCMGGREKPGMPGGGGAWGAPGGRLAANRPVRMDMNCKTTAVLSDGKDRMSQNTSKNEAKVVRNSVS